MESFHNDWRRICDGQSPPCAEFKRTIQKSPHDNRKYRLIRLENGLEAMLIHDPQADQAAASLNVAVGHLSDPVSQYEYILVS
jgi:insulysin